MILCINQLIIFMRKSKMLFQICCACFLGFNVQDMMKINGNFYFVGDLYTLVDCPTQLTRVT